MLKSSFRYSNRNSRKDHADNSSQCRKFLRVVRSILLYFNAIWFKNLSVMLKKNWKLSVILNNNSLNYSFQVQKAISIQQKFTYITRKPFAIKNIQDIVMGYSNQNKIHSIIRSLGLNLWTKKMTKLHVSHAEKNLILL